jgi:hypothetical protein
MKSPSVKGAAFVFAVALGAIGAGNANASVQYSYVGADYTTIYGSGYKATEDVTLSFIMAAPLGMNFSGFVAPTSFTAFDGINTISNDIDTAATFDI